MKKLKFQYYDETIKLSESTHAELFRKFFAWWKEHDLATAIYGTTKSGLRLSPNEMYEGTVIKKKNLEITPGLYIITHITPAAMDKGLYGFLDAVGAEVLEPKRPEKKKSPAKKSEPKADNDENEEDDKETADEVADNQKEALVSDVEIEQIATKAATANYKTKNGKTVMENMQSVVERLEAERVAKYKERLAKGNRA